MNVINDFFDADTWDEALWILRRRRKELFEEPARVAFETILESFGKHDIAAQILDTYLDLVQLAAKEGIGAVIQLFTTNGEIPKLTTEIFAELGRVRDAASARIFTLTYPQIAQDLIMQQVWQDDPFWIMLFASARVVRYSSDPKKSQFKKTAVVVHDSGVNRKAFKVLGLSDGGLALTAPYHKARSGSMNKVPFDLRNTGGVRVEVSETIPFHASDRVKLSYHVDGFVQFSGEDSSKIISGRDPETGEPRGFGLFCRPLAQPVQSGPSVGCSIWGLEDFDIWSPRNSEGAVIFEAPEDFYSEPDSEDTGYKTPVSGYHIPCFIFPSALLENAVGRIDTGDEMSMRIPMNIYNRDTLFRVKTIRISAETVLGVIARKQAYQLGARSGFELSGPNDGRYNMFAIYPALSLKDKGQNLDYGKANKEPQ
jgi:hypothetical protein